MVDILRVFNTQIKAKMVLWKPGQIKQSGVVNAATPRRLSDFDKCQVLPFWTASSVAKSSMTITKTSSLIGQYERQIGKTKYEITQSDLL